MALKNNYPGRILKGTKSQPSLKGASGVWTLDEALQYHRANQWPQPNLYQPIANSLRFKYQTSGNYPAYQNSQLNHYIGRNGNQYAWTFSAWVKPSLANGSGVLFGASSGSAASGDYRAHINFGSSGNTLLGFRYSQIQVATYVNFDWVPNFRDPSAWYHVVVVFDSLNATLTNRMRAWVNGVQQTVSGTPTCAQGQTTIINQPGGTGVSGANLHRVGACNDYYGNPGYWYDGLMGEVNFVDGYALQPTLFGQYDSNNVWVPIPYTGSYGTNGFYLPFTNAQTSQTLGYDAGLNGTTTYNADQDPYRGSVALHLTGNGPAGGQNNTFTDSSVNNLAFTRNGSTTQGSFSPFPFNNNVAYNPSVNGASAYFNGSTDYIYTGSNSVFNVGSNNVTVEAWVYLTAFNQGASPYISTIWSLDGSGTNNTFFYVYRTGSIAVGINGVNEIASATGVITLNNWYHTAVVRNGSTTTVYVNGVSVASNTTSVWANTGSRPFYVGSNPQSAYYYLTGYISSVRFLMNAVVYTAAFTPTNRPFGTLTNNLITFSEDFTNAYWTQTRINVTPGAGIAPDGTPTAQQISGQSQAYAYPRRILTVSATTAYTLSVYAKAGSLTNFRIWPTDNVSANWYADVNLLTGAYTVGNANATNPTCTTTNVGNGWWRVSLTLTTTSSTTLTADIGYLSNGGGDVGSVFTSSQYIYLWGAQLEQASSASNYTPTPANYSTAPSLLLNFANAAIVDSTGANDIVTIGSATVTSSSKYGSGALTFNGTTDRLEISGPSAQSSGSAGLYGLAPSLIPGTKDFTVEYWLNTRTGNDNYHRIVSSSNGAFSGGTFCMRHQPGSFLFSGQLSYSTDFTLNTWTHVAYTRQGATGRGFINGRQVGICTDSTNYTEAIQYVGSFYSAGAGEYFSGQLDDVRITMGVARYQSDFTPPARALPEIGGKSFVTVNVNAGVVKSFTTVGTTSWTAPTDVTQIEVLVVAGGGGGGGVGNSQGGGGGGGGAGGLLYNNQYPVTPGQTYTILVGAGGTAGLGPGTTGQGGNGGNSQFGNLIAIGGGGGDDADRGHGALSGGSGGGGGGGGAGGRAGASGTPGQGFSGTTGYGSGQNYPGGGGGGAGGVGSTPTASAAGGGGAGLGFGISGTYQYYAGGGGGGINTTTYGSPTLGAGGSGVGGNGGVNSIGLPGTNGTGGGGGAGGGDTGHAGGAGGSGIVVVRYTTQTVANTSDSTTDNLVDSPTLYGHDLGNGGEVVGNYATWNPLFVPQGGTWGIKNGGLTAVANISTAAYIQTFNNIGVTSGLWYSEVQFIAGTNGVHSALGFGISNNTNYFTANGTNNPLGYTSTPSWSFYVPTGNKQYNGTSTPYGAAIVSGDIIMTALDMNNGAVYWGKNGVWFNNGNPATQTNPAFTGITGTVFVGVNDYAASGYPCTWNANFGQRAWQYTPPQGFSALTTKNFVRPTGAAATPNQYFDTVLYTGNGTNTANSLTITGLNFQPDLIWIKNRGTTDSHWIQDTVRGLGYALQSNTTSADAVTGGGDVSSTTSNGFIISYANTRTNASSNNYVAWCWRANGAAVSNTNGTVTSQVSANTTAGFSIVSYTGTGVQATVGHGLGATPSFIILKNRTDGTRGWPVWHTALGTAGYMYLNSTQASATDNSTWGTMTSTTFGLGNGTTPNTSWNETGSTFVAYCWTAIPGFSAFGSYAANGSADGPFVYTGFKPRWIMMKRYDTGSAENWFIVDTARDPSNYGTGQHYLLPASSAADGTGTAILDVLSNGFKLRSTATNAGAGGPAYIYAAFASAPLTNTNGTAF